MVGVLVVGVPHHLVSVCELVISVNVGALQHAATTAPCAGAALAMLIFSVGHVHPDSPMPEKGSWSTLMYWTTSLK
jgi:hypothetical protein